MAFLVQALALGLGAVPEPRPLIIAECEGCGIGLAGIDAEAKAYIQWPTYIMRPTT